MKGHNPKKAHFHLSGRCVQFERNLTRGFRYALEMLLLVLNLFWHRNVGEEIGQRSYSPKGTSTPVGDVCVQYERNSPREKIIQTDRHSEDRPDRRPDNIWHDVVTFPDLNFIRWWIKKAYLKKIGPLFPIESINYKPLTPQSLIALHEHVLQIYNYPWSADVPIMVQSRWPIRLLASLKLDFTSSSDIQS